jgi:hypothetical protein
MSSASRLSYTNGCKNDAQRRISAGCHQSQIVGESSVQGKRQLAVAKTMRSACSMSCYKYNKSSN